MWLEEGSSWRRFHSNQQGDRFRFQYEGQLLPGVQGWKGSHSHNTTQIWPSCPYDWHDGGASRPNLSSAAIPCASSSCQPAALCKVKCQSAIPSSVSCARAMPLIVLVALHLCLKYGIKGVPYLLSMRHFFISIREIPYNMGL